MTTLTNQTPHECWKSSIHAGPLFLKVCIIFVSYVDSLDWKNPTPEQIEKRVLSRVKPGSIVLFHNGAKNTSAALSHIFQTLQSQEYEIVPVSQLIYKDNYTIDSAGMQIRKTQISSDVS